MNYSQTKGIVLCDPWSVDNSNPHHYPICDAINEGPLDQVVDEVWLQLLRWNRELV